MVQGGGLCSVVDGIETPDLRAAHSVEEGAATEIELLLRILT